MTFRMMAGLALVGLMAGCSKSGPVVISFVDYSTKKPVCDGIELRGAVVKQGAASTPDKTAPQIALTKSGDCAFAVALPPVGDDEVLATRVDKAGYATGSWMMSGKALKDPAQVKRLATTPIELVPKSK